MFDKLIDSAPARPKRRFLGFFFGTSILYLLAMTAALVVSVLITNPELAHTSELKSVPIMPPPKQGVPNPPPAKEQPSQKQAQPDIYNPVPLEEAVKSMAAEPTTDRSKNPPTSTLIEGAGTETGVERGDPRSHGFIPGTGTDRKDLPDTTEPPPPPPVAASKQPKRDDQSPLKVPSTVLQGKAIDRRTPVYPRMAIIARVEGSVSVEVVISPEGRVEVARAVSGHPLLKPSAAEAARLWRFQPTRLNGSPVRVTGIITFVFKLD